MVFPFYYAIVTSFKTARIVQRRLFSPCAGTGNYIAVFREQPFAHNIFNSVLVSFTVVALSLLWGDGGVRAGVGAISRGADCYYDRAGRVDVSAGRGAVRHVRADPGPGTATTCSAWSFPT